MTVMKRILYAVLIAAALFLTCAAGEASLDSALPVIVNASGSDVRVYRRPDAGSTRIGNMNRGEKLPVMSESEGWYLVPVGLNTGYVRAEDVIVCGSAQYTHGVSSDSVCITGFGRPGDYLKASGWFLSESPIGCVRSELCSLDGGEALSSYSFDAKGADRVRAADAVRQLRFPRERSLSYYKLSIWLTSGGIEKRVLTQTVCAQAGFRAAASINERTRVNTNGREAFDGSFVTHWYSAGNHDTLTFSAAEPISHMTVSWLTASPEFVITYLDADGNTLGTETTDTGTPLYRCTYSVPAHTEKVTIYVQSGSGITEISLYGLSDTEYQDFRPLPEKTDMLVFSAHPDDEVLWFGGVIPYYVNAGRTVGVVYMTSASWVRRTEALNACYYNGVKYHPVFCDLKDRGIPSYEETKQVWGDEGLLCVVRAIRRYKPEVVVSHDLEGEYGHNQHRLTAALMREAMSAAADPLYDPESAEQYGIWQVKKLYRHLYPENRIVMNWYAPGSGMRGLSAIDTAYLAFDCYSTQSARWNMDMGKTYYNALFGLAYTAVGADELRNDMFENIN